jgi:hypothetical protein
VRRTGVGRRPYRGHLRRWGGRGHPRHRMRARRAGAVWASDARSTSPASRHLA